MHLLTRIFTELGLLRVQNIDFHYISILSWVILANFVLSHYVVTVARKAQSLISQYPNYKITTQILEFVIRIKRTKFSIFLT